MKGEEQQRIEDLNREGWASAVELKMQVDRLKAIVSRLVTALESVPDPSASELALIDEAKGLL